jgi:hypothetical protein
MSAINHGTEVPEGSRREVLMGYQYALHQHKKKLREERDMFMRSQDNNSASSEEYWDDYSDDSEYSRERRRDPKHNRRTMAQSREERYSRSMTPQLEVEEEDFVQETPEAALTAAQAYLLTTRPEPGDPREHMHQVAMQSLGLIEDKIMGKGLEAKSTRYKERRKEEFKRKTTRNESSESSEEERRQKRKEDARNIIAQARVNISRHTWKKKIMKTMKKRWARCALPAGFAKCGYPKDSNYRTTSKNMMDRKSLPYGCRITYRQYRY